MNSRGQAPERGGMRLPQLFPGETMPRKTVMSFELKAAGVMELFDGLAAAYAASTDETAKSYAFHAINLYMTSATPDLLEMRWDRQFGGPNVLTIDGAPGLYALQNALANRVPVREWDMKWWFGAERLERIEMYARAMRPAPPRTIAPVTPVPPTSSDPSE